MKRILLSIFVVFFNVRSTYAVAFWGPRLDREDWEDAGHHFISDFFLLSLMLIGIVLLVIGVVVYSLWKQWNDKPKEERDKITSSIKSVVGFILGSLVFFFVLRCVERLPKGEKEEPESSESTVSSTSTPPDQNNDASPSVDYNNNKNQIIIHDDLGECEDVPSGCIEPLETYLSVSTSDIISSSDGGTISITVNTNATWYCLNVTSWIHYRYNGNQLVISIDTNFYNTSRAGTLIVKAGDKEQKIIVIQDPYSNPANISAEILGVKVDHNVILNGEKGMNIHVSFNAYGMLHRRGQVVAYFYFSNGQALKDYNQKFRTIDGNVSVGKNFTPSYVNCLYSDLVIFFPYNELHLNFNTDCYFYVQLFYGNQCLATSSKQYFNYSVGR